MTRADASVGMGAQHGALLAFAQGSTQLNVPLTNGSAQSVGVYRLCNGSLAVKWLQLSPLRAAYAAERQARDRTSTTDAVDVAEIAEIAEMGGRQMPPPLTVEGRPCDLSDELSSRWRCEGQGARRPTRAASLHARLGGIVAGMPLLALSAIAFALTGATLGTIGGCAWQVRRYRTYRVVGLARTPAEEA